MPQLNVSCKASMHIGKKWSASHNRRTYDKGKWNLDGHIAPELSHLNVTLCDEDYKTWFHRTFDAAIDEFNAKNAGKHNDRLIDKEKYCAEQFGKVQECIIQLGDHGTYVEMEDAIGRTAANELHIHFLTEAFKQWQKDNPAFQVFSAIIHMDEIRDGTPHLHLDFMPVAQSKRGLGVKVSMDGALKENGFERKKGHKYAETPYKLWLGVQRERIEALAAEYVNLIPSEHNTGKQHVETWQYRSEQARKECAELQAEHQRMTDEVKDLREEQERIAAEMQPLREAKVSAEEVKVSAKDSLFGGKVTLKKEDFEKIQEQAAAYRVHQSDLADLVAARQKFEKHKAVTEKIMEHNTKRLASDIEEAKNQATMDVRRQLAIYEKQAKERLEIAKRQAEDIRKAAEKELAISKRQRQAADQALIQVQQKSAQLEKERALAKKAQDEAEKAYRRNQDACRLRDEAEEELEQLKEDSQREINHLNFRIRELVGETASLEDKYEKFSEEMERWQIEVEGRHGGEILYIEQQCDAKIEEMKKQLDHTQHELEAAKSKLMTALGFAKESCQAIGMLLNYRNPDYFADNLTYRQESLIEAVRELGVRLFQKLGMSKTADEVERQDGLTKRLEELVDDKTYEKSYGRGGMTL